MTNDLITRLESADGPDRELDWAIAESLGWIRRQVGQVIACYAPGDPHMKAGAPRYTASIDAALTLVPDGWNWMAGNRNQPIARAYVENGQMAFVGLGGMKRNPDRQWFECVASTPALALAAAALKARGV